MNFSKIGCLFLLATSSSLCLNAQDKIKNMKPEDTEIWKPVPPVVTTLPNQAPSDAIVLFNGHDLNAWESVNQPGKVADWPIQNGIFTVNKKAGSIQTKQKFGDYQLHLEFCIPENISGSGQARGNSGLFLAAPGGKESVGYELQIMDSYNNPTYVNGQLGTAYKQKIPLINPARKPGEWQTVDVIWSAPRFHQDGSLEQPATLTAIVNGVLTLNHVALDGQTVYIGKPTYEAHGPSPIQLQSHGDPSEPISFKNIWVRPL